MRAIGLFLLLLGLLCVGAGLLLGLGLGSIYAAGFVTTAGRQGGGDLVLVLAAAALLLGLGWVLIRFGRALRSRPAP